MEERSKPSKTLYKVELCLLKFIPMLTALLFLANAVLSFVGIDLAFLSYIAGISLLPVVFMYVSSYVFRFCGYHRMFLHYAVVSNILNITDYYVGIPLDDLSLFCLHMIIAGTALFLILFLYVKSHKRPSAEGNGRHRLRKFKYR